MEITHEVEFAHDSHQRAGFSTAHVATDKLNNITDLWDYQVAHVLASRSMDICEGLQIQQSSPPRFEWIRLVRRGDTARRARI
jgi:hypothetical protein